jgi:hypothetical protein
MNDRFLLSSVALGLLACVGCGSSGDDAKGSSGSGGTSTGGTASGGTGNAATGGSSGAGGTATGGSSGSGGVNGCGTPDGGASDTPRIDCVSGALVDGSEITIVGAGFGDEGPQVVIFDDFEKGTVGQVIQTGSGSAQIGEWAALNGGDPVYGDEYVVSGTKSFKSDFTVDSNQQAFADLPSGTTEIFYSWWQYVPVGHNFPGEGNPDLLNWKVIWLLGDDSISGGTADDDLFFAFLGDGAGPTTTFGGNCSVYTNGSIWPDVATQKGEWKRFAVWDRGRTDSTGGVKIWDLSPSMGLRQVVNEVDVQTLPTDCGAAPHQWERVAFNGYGRSTPAPSNPHLDDFYVAVGPQAQARVELGNAATYEDCTKIALATPTAWNESGISATFRSGPLTGSDAVYLYVHDGEGNGNSEGFPVSF